jgi:energy-coupling factor transporter ATP-binding protein EcfA2
MRRIDHLLIVAGPSGSGKSTLLREMLEGRLPEIGRRAGVEDLRGWPFIESLKLRRLTDLEQKHLILHLDFVWAPYALNEEPPGEKWLSALLEGVREIFFITLWTPPERLERQFLESRLRAPVPPNRGGVLRGRLFRLLPRFVTRTFSRLPLLEQLNRRWPGTALIPGLLAVRIYSSPRRVVALYRRWMRFCDRQSSITRGHLIVEYDTELRIYSRDQWENRIRTREGGGLT